MYATSLWIDWENDRSEISKPSWQDIEEAINRLNGDTVSSLAIEGKAPSHMAIGGGNGRYVAHISFDGRWFHYLRNPKGSVEEEPLVVGDQQIPVANRDICSLETVLDAARLFSLEGKLNENLFWERA